MATLADEFLADLGEDASLPPPSTVDNTNGEEMEQDVTLHPKPIDVLLNGEKLQQLLQEVEQSMKRDTEKLGPIQKQEEYDLVIEANNTGAEITQELQRVNHFIREIYGKKFSELESLVTNPVDYARVVLKIGNSDLEDLSHLDLNTVLPAATVMIVNVQATTTTGTSLTQEEMEQVQHACNVTLALDDARKKLLEYVESRMQVIAPNLSALIGSTVAAKLMGISGGLQALSQMPINTLLGLGKNKKQTLAGFSSSTINPHRGLIAQCSLVVSAPPDIQTKVIRILSGRCALAARVDHSNESPNGTIGKGYKEEIQKKIEKWLEPPPLKPPKPLPAPDDKPKKKRGGKRMRAIKQKYEMTELRKHLNRIPFGLDAQQEFRDTGKTLGMLGLTGGGKVRLSAQDKGILKRQKTKQFTGSSGATSGISSSLAFTPVQGLELKVLPDAAAQKLKDGSDKYFGTSTPFYQVNKVFDSTTALKKKA